MIYPEFTNARLPRYYQNPETGQLEEVRPQLGAGPANPEWTSPPKGSRVGRIFKDDLWYDLYLRDGQVTEVLMDPQPPHLLDL